MYKFYIVESQFVKCQYYDVHFSLEKCHILILKLEYCSFFDIHSETQIFIELFYLCDLGILKMLNKVRKVIESH